MAVTGNDNGKRIPKNFKTGIDFELHENLIYYLNENKPRLCLLSSMEKKVFHLTHDENMHAKIHRCFNRLTKKITYPVFLKKIGVILNIVSIVNSPKPNGINHIKN